MDVMATTTTTVQGFTAIVTKNMTGMVDIIIISTMTDIIDIIITMAGITDRINTTVDTKDMVITRIDIGRRTSILDLVEMETILALAMGAGKVGSNVAAVLLAERKKAFLRQ